MILIFAAAVAILWTIARFGRHPSTISWRDLAFPSRWASYRSALGDRQFRLAADFAGRGQAREALAYARAGLRRAPGNRDGRLLLAALMADFGREAPAGDLLAEGLATFGTDPDYVDAVFKFLRQRHDHPRVISISRRLLTQPNTPAIHLRAAQAGAEAAFDAGQLALATEFLHRADGLAGTLAGRTLQARVDAELGRTSEALDALQQLTRAAPADTAVHGEYLRLLGLAGRTDELRREALRFQLIHPDRPSLRVALARAYHDSGERVRYQNEVTGLRREFSADLNLHLALGDLAVACADPQLSADLLTAAGERGLPAEPFILLHAEALLAARRFPAALEMLRRVSDLDATRLDSERSAADGLRALCHFGQHDAESARLHLGRFLGSRGLRGPHLVAVARRFLQLDGEEPARQVLERAVALEPRNQTALTLLVTVELNLNRTAELPDHLIQLTRMRRPPPELLRVARHQLGSDRYLFAPGRAAALAALEAALDPAPDRARGG